MLKLSRSLSQILICTCVWLCVPLNGQPDAGFIPSSKVQERTLVLVLILDALGEPSGYGSGCLLWDYSSDELEKGRALLLTAEHVLRKAHSVSLLTSSGKNGPRSLTRGPVALRDSLGEKMYLTYTLSSGSESDVALLPVELIPRRRASPIQVLARSYCAFSESVNVGDHLTVFGFPDITIFDFVSPGKPLATAGVVAFETNTSYVMDKKVHKGMSGGIVFKEYPGESEFVYKAVGIVSARLSKYKNYTWITKIDYVDSVLISRTQQKWSD